MNKTAMFTNKTGEVSSADGTFSVVDWDTPIGIVIQFTNQNDSLQLMRRNYENNGWENVTDGRGNVILNSSRKDFAVTFPDTYCLVGKVIGTTTAYTVTA